MSINMENVKKIRIPGLLYKKKIYLTHSSVVYKGTSTPCPVELTLYSKTNSTPTITAINLYNVLTTCGYTMASNSRYYLTVDNPYEFTYNNGTYDCVFASFQSQSATYPIVVWFSVPGATSVNVWQNWAITEDPWQELEATPAFTYEYKQYINSTAGSYTNFTVSNNEYGTEYIANYCIDGVSYPDVTIVSVSGDSYTLSNQEVITVTADHPSVIETGKLVKKIEDGNGNKLWPSTKTGTYTATLTRTSNYAVTAKSDATLLSAISTSTGIPESNITLGTKTYTIPYYRQSTSRPYTAIKNSSQEILFQTLDTSNGSKVATFTTTENLSQIRGYVGDTDTAITYNFGTSYAYFRSGTTFSVTVSYEYIQKEE